ncbi:ArnT family glycosyltransferase [Microbacterium sp. NPDC056569]|uniref:ArnT family glycosyltransferase n=1 Tax=Microbacterium sp. NPDC056569 TaxID=3345867 RepID=UPI00366A6086
MTLERTDSASTLAEGPARRRPDRLIIPLLVAIVVVGGTVRFAGVTWGLPLLLHPDEWVVVGGAIDLAERNSFAPAYFFRPDHLEIQLSYLAFQAWSHLVMGMPAEAAYAISPAPFYAISRALTAAFGTAMIPLAYLIGRDHSRWAGLFAAFGIAFFPPFVEHSRYATPDIPLAFTVLVVLYACIAYTRTSSWWWLALACLGVAAGITVKYPAIVGTAAIAAVVIVDALRHRAPLRIVSRGGAAIGMVVGMTFLLSPTLFTNASEVARQFSVQNAGTHLGAGGLGFFGNAAFYVTTFVESGGVLVAVFAGVGVVALLLRDWGTLVPYMIGLVYWIALSSLSLHWDRWGLPVYAVTIVLGGIGVHTLWSMCAGLRRQRVPARAAVAVIASLSGVTLLAGTAAQVAYAAAPDTRSTAAGELQALGATPANTAFDGYTPFHPQGPGSIASGLTLTEGQPAASDGSGDVRYVLTSSLMSDRYLAEPERQPQFDLYSAVAELPVVEVWGSLGLPPRSPVELTQIVAAGDYVHRLLRGATVGPELTLYRLPN